MRPEIKRPWPARRVMALPAVAALLTAICLSCASGAAASASSGRVSVGGPNVNGYCQHLGFAAARITAPPTVQWQCERPDGSTAPVDLQAACEFSYAQRPILAEQLTPGVLVTWQCLVAKSAAPGGLEVGPPGGSTSVARLRTALAGALAPRGAAARIRTLLRHGSYPMLAGGLAAGSLHVSWSFQPRRLAGHRRPKAITVATGGAVVSSAGSATVTITLTGAGRRLLKRATRVALTATGALSTVGAGAVSATRAFTLSR